MSQEFRQNVSTSSAQEILESFGVLPKHLAMVAKVGQEANVSPVKLVAAFYEWLDDRPWKPRFFPHGVPQAVRTEQTKYWREFLNGSIDDAYIASRLSVGATHARIELPPMAYTTAMAFSQRWLSDSIRRSTLPKEEVTEAIEAISVLCQLDSALVMEAYAEHSNQKIQAEANSLSQINSEISRVVVAASEGDFSHRYELQGKRHDDLGQAVNQMVEMFKKTVAQIRAVAEGDYSTMVEPRSKQDELGTVLQQMTTKLRQATERTDRDQWVKQGQADVFETLRGEQTLEALCRSVIAYLGPKLRCPVGCVYSVDDDGSLYLQATYGVKKTSLPASFAFGEGVVGEVANRKEALMNFDISANPVRGSFGLGEIVLTRLSCIPLVSDGQLHGILQLASPDDLNSTQEELLTLLSENIAIAIDAARSRVRMSLLLEESQSQQEQLQRQAEELRVSNEELEEQTQALQQARSEVLQKNEDLEGKQAAIRRSKEELEVRAKELASASKYKSEFLANMSHELRTPLNSLLILAGNLFANQEGNLTPKQVESLGVIQSGGRDLLRLINDILDLSKVEAGKLAVHVTPTSLQTLVGSLRQQFTPIAEQSQVELSFHLDPSAPGTIETDVQRVEQILRNLLSNALKFTSEGSVRLRIQAGSQGQRLRSAHLADSPTVSFSVEDTGIGIPRDKQLEIFEAFQQADGSTSRQYGGTGLGLTVSRQLATLLEGELHLKSEEGAGSTFTLVLPQKPARGSAGASSKANGAWHPNGGTPSAASAQEVKASTGRAPTVKAPTTRTSTSEPLLLIVEDDVVFAETLATTVREHGYAASVTHTGKDAVLLAQQKQPQGIILDLGLPDIDGLQVLEQLKHNLQTRHIPVHVVSGHECRPDALQHGAVGFLQKPVEVPHLAAIFERFERLWSRKSGRILVLEDDFNNQVAIRQLLASENVALDMASTGEDALAMLDDADYDCVVVDLGLPDMDGSEFLQRLDAQHPPVVVYTAQEISEDKLDILRGYTQSIVIKGARSPERLVDEVSLFLHQVATTLPEAQRSTLMKLHDPSSSLRGKKILVTDDDMRNVFAMTEMLQRHGMEVLQAKNGKVALEKLAENADIDLAVMDVMMPVMDGFETMRRIREKPEFKNLPIIAVTAKTLPEDKQACLEAGASDYIPKPMDPDNLLALMRILLFDADRGRNSSETEPVGQRGSTRHAG